MGCLSACAAVSAALAFACALAALALPGLIRWRLDAAVREQIVWSVDSPPFVYSHFARDTHPGDPTVYFRAWFLNITNLEDVRVGGKPVLVSGASAGCCRLPAFLLRMQAACWRSPGGAPQPSHPTACTPGRRPSWAPTPSSSTA